MSKPNHKNLHGFPVLVLDGKEITSTHPMAKDEKTKSKVNGPHHNSKWGRHLLNAPSQAEHRRRRVGLVQG